MIKFFGFSALLIFIFSNIAFSQSENKKIVANVKLSIFTEKTVWNKSTPLIVNVEMENLSESSINLPTSISFMLADKTIEGRIGSNSLSSPVSLTKHYDGNINSCQNDLTEERFNKTRAILPPTRSFVLEKGEKKEFSFDLAKMCWNRLISSVYPNQNLFPLVKSGKYKLSIEKSNEIEIEIK